MAAEVEIDGVKEAQLLKRHVLSHDVCVVQGLFLERGVGCCACGGSDACDGAICTGGRDGGSCVVEGDEEICPMKCRGR